MLIVGEGLNSSIPRVGEAIQTKDASSLANLDREQKESGADMLDVNTAATRNDEAEILPSKESEVSNALFLDMKQVTILV